MKSLYEKEGEKIQEQYKIQEKHRGIKRQEDKEKGKFLLNRERTVCCMWATACSGDETTRAFL